MSKKIGLTSKKQDIIAEIKKYSPITPLLKDENTAYQKSTKKELILLLRKFETLERAGEEIQANLKITEETENRLKELREHRKILVQKLSQQLDQLNQVNNK